MRWLAMVLLAVALAGCGGSTRTVTATVNSTVVRATTTSTGTTPVPVTVMAVASRSVLPVSCSNPNAALQFAGTGFRVANGVVTASHVVAACPGGTWLGFGWACATTENPTHDLAVVSCQGDFSWKPLQPSPAPAYVGQSLGLIGVPSGLGEPVVLRGVVAATRQTVHLTSTEGPGETLTDAIQVRCPGVLPGDSGGPAIDAAGKVVGVIEGAGAGIVTLTPASDLSRLG